MSGMFFSGFLFISTHILLDLLSLGSAKAYTGQGGKINSHLMVSCVRNIPTKIYQNLLIDFQVTVKNVANVFLRRSVIADIHRHAACHKWPWTLKILVFSDFLAIYGCKRVNCDEVDRNTPRLLANRNCYRLSRASWALAQISCFRGRAVRPDCRSRSTIRNGLWSFLLVINSNFLTLAQSRTVS